MAEKAAGAHLKGGRCLQQIAKEEKELQDRLAGLAGIRQKAQEKLYDLARQVDERMDHLAACQKAQRQKARTTPTTPAQTRVRERAGASKT